MFNGGEEGKAWMDGGAREIEVASCKFNTSTQKSIPYLWPEFPNHFESNEFPCSPCYQMVRARTLRLWLSIWRWPSEHVFSNSAVQYGQRTVCKVKVLTRWQEPNWWAPDVGTDKLDHVNFVHPSTDISVDISTSTDISVECRSMLDRYVGRDVSVDI